MASVNHHPQKTVLTTGNHQELFTYWHQRVEFKNHHLIRSTSHLPAYEIRHQCTNYDQLIKLPEVESLKGLERDRIFAIIKYQCTSRVLQYRASHFRAISSQIRLELDALNAKNQENLNWIEKLKQLLFSKDIEIKQLKAQVILLEAEKEVLQAETDQSSAYVELSKEVEKLKKQYEKEKKRREELGHNNQSLGGRVAHAERYRRERDQAREEVKQLRAINQQLEAQLAPLNAVRPQPTKGK